MKYAIRFALAIALLALFVNPVQAALPAPDLAVTGSFALGRCLSPAHQDMGAGLYAQAPAYFNPVAASDAQLACYGFPPRPADAKGRAEWEQVMNLHHPRQWVRGAPGAPMTAVSRAMDHPADTYVGTVSTDIWGGLMVLPNAGHQFWLIQGQWIVPNPNAYDGRLISQWVGLGCCANFQTNLLMQGGTYVQNATCAPRPGCPGVKTGFFWEVPDGYQNGTKMPMQAITAPTILVGQVAAFVVLEDPTYSDYEACNESTHQCSWTPVQPYTSGTSPQAEWIVEDTTAGAGAGYAPPYSPVHFVGPVAGANNENIVDDHVNPASWLPNQLNEFSYIMGRNGVGYLAPSTVAANTAFSVCPGTYPPGHVLTAPC